MDAVNIVHLQCGACQHGYIDCGRTPTRYTDEADGNTVDIMRRKMRRRKTYHHGNLREALLEAAIRLIAEVGPNAFTLREVARRAAFHTMPPIATFAIVTI